MKTAADDIVEKIVEFVPFQAREAVKLSVSIVRRFLCRPTRSGKECTDEQAIRFIMLCKARGLNPFEGDAFIVGYDTKDGPEFSLITAHQCFAKRAEAHSQFDGMDSGVIVKDSGGGITERQGDFLYPDDVLMGAWATVHRKDWKHPMRARVRLETFNKNRSRWEADPAGMIVKCAEADALRRAFPNQVSGMYNAEEMASVVPQPLAIEAKPSNPAPDWVAGNGAEKEPVTLADRIRKRAPKKEAAPGAPGPAKFEPRASLEQLAVIDKLILKLGVEPEGVNSILRRFEVPAFAKLTPDKATDLISMLEAELQDAENQTVETT